MISIIIPLWNRFTHFSNCIRSLERHRKGYEIIVVDYGSTDGDVETRLRLSGVPWKVVKLEPPFVRAVALNAGANEAEGDTLVFLDADMTVPPGFIGMVEQKVSGRHAWFPRCAVQLPGGVVTPNDPLSVRGYGNCAITRTDFNQAGGWDEGFREWGGEDAAFFKRVRAEGIFADREILPEFVHQYHDKSAPVTPAPPVVSSKAPPVVSSKPKPPPAVKAAPPVSLGPKPKPKPGKDVLLATYSPEHALYLARLRPYFEALGFAVYEKTGTRDYAWLAREKATIIIAWNCALPEQIGFLEYTRKFCCDHFLVAEVGWFPGASKEYGGATTLCLDRKGINAASEIRGFTPPMCSVEEEEQLDAWIKARITKRAGRKVVTLVPLQLENDTNIVGNSPRFKSMQELIDFVESKVDGPITFKQHPRDEKGKYTVANKKSLLTTEGDLYDMIARAKQVIGINSTVLLESLLFGKKVAAFGVGLFTGHDVIVDCSEDPDDIHKLAQIRFNKQFHARRKAFLYELIFRRQIDVADLDAGLARNRVLQEVLAQCE